MNLVVGATGLTGLEICRQLAGRTEPLRALVRRSSDPAKVDELRRLGAETVLGDLRDRASLDAACQGARAVLSTATVTSSRQEGDSIETVDRSGHRDLIDASVAAGVERFVFVSFRNRHVDYPLALAKRAVEGHLAASGLVYTSLQASWFNEVWLTPRLGFDVVAGKAKIFGTGENRISWISYVDVARFAVASLDTPAAENAIIEIGGPEALTMHEVVRIFEEESGSRLVVEYVSEEALRKMRSEAADPLQASAAGAMLHNADGDEIDMSTTARTFGVEPSTVRAYARSVLGRERGPDRLPVS